MWKSLIAAILTTGLIVPVTIAELTKDDIREIETIAQKSENRLREYIDLKLAAQDAKISEQFAKVDNQFTEQDKRL